jgi:hypothetical protein
MVSREEPSYLLKLSMKALRPQQDAVLHEGESLCVWHERTDCFTAWCAAMSQGTWLLLTMLAGMCFTIEPMVQLGTHEDVHWPDAWTGWCLLAVHVASHSRARYDG